MNGYTKNIIAVLILLPTFLLCSCKQETQNARIILEKYENGNYKVIHQFLKDTANLNDDYYYEYYYENQQIKTRGLISQGNKIGEWNHFYENGNLEIKCNYINDTLHGIYQDYSLDGKMQIEGNYIMGRKINE